jgi:hypothetical protein
VLKPRPVETRQSVSLSQSVTVERLSREMTAPLVAAIARSRSYQGPVLTSEANPLLATGVEGRLALEADIAGSEPDDLGSPPTGEHEREEERPIPSSSDRLGHDREQSADLVSAK